MTNRSTIQRHAAAFRRQVEKRGWDVEAVQTAGSGESVYVTVSRETSDDADPIVQTIRFSTHSPFVARNGRSDFYAYPPETGWREALAWIESKLPR